MPHNDLNDFFDDGLRYLKWMGRQIGWLAKGAPGLLDRNRSEIVYSEGNFPQALSLLRKSLKKHENDTKLILKIARWVRYGMVPYIEARRMFEFVIEEGRPDLAREATAELINLAWEREGALSAAELVARYERWLEGSDPARIRRASLLNEAGLVEPAMDLLRDVSRTDPDALRRIGYLNLVIAAEQAGLGPFPQGGYARRVSNRLKRGNRRLQELLHTVNDVAIVANGTSLKGRGLGPVIDAHRLVMRFNNHEGGIDIPDQGARTDIWVRSLHSKHVPWREPDPALIIFLGSNIRNSFPKAIHYLKRFPKTTADIAIFPSVYYSKLFSKLNASPSSGILGLSVLARKNKGQLSSSQVFGYSLYENTHNSSIYHGGEVRQTTPSRHNWKAEQKLYQSLVRSDQADP